jgi:hypothetical protein
VDEADPDDKRVERRFGYAGRGNGHVEHGGGGGAVQGDKEGHDNDRAAGAAASAPTLIVEVKVSRRWGREERKSSCAAIWTDEE